MTQSVTWLGNTKEEMPDVGCDGVQGAEHRSVGKEQLTKSPTTRPGDKKRRNGQGI